MRILIVEDEVDFLTSMKQYFERQQFAVDAVTTGEQALALAEYNIYDVILLDVNLPDTIGFTLCAAIHQTTTYYVPIIMVTARDEVSDRIKGLDSGADDYVVKPFDFAELRARVMAVIRRTKGKKVADMHIGDIQIIPETLSIVIDGVNVIFSPKEYEILFYLALTKPTPQSLETIIAHVWDDEVDPFSNAARVHIVNIRKKLGKYSKNVTIETIKLKGYYLCIH